MGSTPWFTISFQLFDSWLTFSSGVRLLVHCFTKPFRFDYLFTWTYRQTQYNTNLLLLYVISKYIRLCNSYLSTVSIINLRSDESLINQQWVTVQSQTSACHRLRLTSYDVTGPWRACDGRDVIIAWWMTQCYHVLRTEPAGKRDCFYVSGNIFEFLYRFI